MDADSRASKPPTGAIAYCWAQLRVRTDGAAGISVTGCIVDPDGTLNDVTGAGDYQFDVGVPLTYGIDATELATAVENALSAGWGITGLSNVKFVPTF